MPTRQKKSYFNAKTEPTIEQPRTIKTKDCNETNAFEPRSSKSPLKPKQQPQHREKEKVRSGLAERELPGLMFEG